VNPGATPWAALAGLFGVALTLGTGHVMARLAFSNGVGVLTAATLRSLCATALVLALLRLRGTRLLPLPDGARAMMLLGVAIAAQTVLVQVAVSRLPVALAILLFYTYPIFTSVASAALGAERFTPRLGIALAAAFAGLVLVLSVSPEGIDAWGVAAGLGASVAFTTALVLTPRWAPALDAVSRTAFTMGTAATIFSVASIASGGFHWPAGAAALVGLLGLGLCYAVGIVVLFLLLPRVGPTRAAFVLNLEPVVVAVVAWLLLGEALHGHQPAGVALVVGAVIGYQWRPGRGAPPADSTH
jgi:drug/metabolite transporter (DMT)-like permease